MSIEIDVPCPADGESQPRLQLNCVRAAGASFYNLPQSKLSRVIPVLCASMPEPPELAEEREPEPQVRLLVFLLFWPVFMQGHLACATKVCLLVEIPVGCAQINTIIED